MPRFTLAMDCDHAAFGDDPAPEAARILRAIADRLDAEGAAWHFQTIHDANGNDVGRWRLR